MAERKKGAPTNAARIRIPLVPFGMRVAYHEGRIEKLAKKYDPDTVQRGVQDKALGRLKVRRVVEKVEKYGGAALAVTGGAVIFFGGVALAPEIVVATGVVLAVDGVRRAWRDRRFGLNKKVSELTTLQATDTGQSVAGAAQAVREAEAQASKARAAIESGMVGVINGTSDAAGLEALLKARDEAAAAVVQGRENARSIAAAAGGAVAERQTLADNYFLEQNGRWRVRVRAARLARLAQRTWEDSKTYMNRSGNSQGTAEGVEQASRDASKIYKERRDHAKAQRKGGNGTNSQTTNTVLEEQNDNVPQ